MFYTFEGPGAGPFPFQQKIDSVSQIICVVGTADGDVRLSSDEFTVQPNEFQLFSPGGMVTLKKPIPRGCFVTIGTGDVHTPIHLKPTGTLSPANPPEEEYPTVPSQGYALIHLTGDIDADFDTVPGEKQVIVKVNAAAFAAEAEYAQSATSTQLAAEANHAKIADDANHATSADTAKKADKAQTAEQANRAKSADQATHATSADSASQAATANEAKTADFAKTAKTADEATHSASADRSNEAQFAWQAQTLASGAVVDTALHAGTADNASNANEAYKAQQSNLAERAKQADKAADANYAETANISNMARRDCLGRVIYQTYLTKEEAGQIYPTEAELQEAITSLDNAKADKDELLATATIGGKANGTGVVNGTNLELTITSINGLIEGDDGALTPISPQDWFQFVDNTSEISDPTLGYALKNPDATSFPTSNAQFVFVPELPEPMNMQPTDVYCVFTNDAQLEEENSIGWALNFSEDLDKSKIWNIRNDGSGLQDLPQKQFFRVVYDALTGWNVLVSPSTGLAQTQIDRLQERVEALENRSQSIKDFIQFKDALNPDELSSDFAIAILA